MSLGSSLALVNLRELVLLFALDVISMVVRNIALVVVRNMQPHMAREPHIYVGWTFNRNFLLVPVEKYLGPVGKLTRHDPKRDLMSDLLKSWAL